MIMRNFGFLVVLVKVVQGFQLQGAGPLVAQLGGSVLLPCAAETPLPLVELGVEWRRTDSGALVHLFQDGDVRPESQDFAYKDRAHFFPVEMSNGNFSILLKNVSHEDTGLYSCKVYIENTAEEVRVDLVRVEYLVVTGSGVVSASLGKEVVLSCSVDSHVLPEGLMEVTWMRADQEIIVLRYQHGEVLPDVSHHRYRGRAEFFTSEISKGNFSLRLKDVRTEDTGEYICDAHTSNHTGKATVRLSVLGLSLLHCLVLVCCAASFVITIVAVAHFMSYRAKQDLARRHGKDLAVHFLLFFSPNVLLFTGYLLWGLAEDLFSEAVAGSVVNFARILLLLLTSPYLGALCDSLQKLIKCVSVSVVHTVITVAVYSDAYIKRLNWISAGIFSTSHVHKTRLQGYFGAIIFLSLCGICPDIYSAYTLPCMLPRSELGLHPQREPSKQAWTFLLLETCSIFQMLFLSVKSSAFNHDIRNTLIFAAPLFPISVLLIRRLVRNRKPRWGCLCWTVTMGIWMPVYFVVTISVVGHIQDAAEAILPGEGTALLCVFALLKMLTGLSLSNHPDKAPELLHTIVYVFGAAGLSIVNSVGLATKLLLTSGYGSQNVPDLRLITIPLECLFVFGWFALQIHGYWARNTRTASNSETHEDLILQDSHETNDMTTS
ncbi:hypothetical protein ACEWY4_015243 [Coilia grayii]|uniref:Ig-like domain-containing protein n=1 Tax=Coilia grayii TaxID=363190 RepID=A0ABD1JNF2_9TELE